jgi:hypothetical protein
LPLSRDYVAFVAVAYAFSWTLLIAGVKLGWSEDCLSLSVAGPTVAALLLWRSPTTWFRFSGMRWPWFFSLPPVCWIVLSVRSSWWSASGGLPVHLKLLQLIPALAPAWILSSVASTNEGVRSVGRRLLHPPTRWSAFALLFFPVLLGIPSAIAAVFGARLVWPGLGGITLVSAAVVFLIPLTIILTWFYNRSGRSIQTVVLFHRAMNTFPYGFAYYQPAWFVVFVFAAYTVIADRMWSRTPRKLKVAVFAD